MLRIPHCITLRGISCQFCSLVWLKDVYHSFTFQRHIFYNYMLWFFKRFYLILERGEGREKEGKRNINVWLPLMWAPLGTWPATRACALTGNWTGNPLVHSPCSIHWATPARIWLIYFIYHLPLPPLCSLLECKLHEDGDVHLRYSLLCPQHLHLCLELSSWSLNIHKWIKFNFNIKFI